MYGTTYPISVFCIIATEFCERFSFCGLRTILSLYLRNELLFSENAATIIYHVFIMICYIIPIVGAICADSYIGRYRTILYFSLIYLIGNILMCFAAIPRLDVSPIILTSFGLSLIAIGTGGIKPCVAAFGGDQFHLPHQKHLLQQFFSIFYFSINLGGFVGMILTPVLRKSIVCFGEDTCYALGFGFPAILMLLALCLFILGKPFYRLKTPNENIMLCFVRCALYAVSQKYKSKDNTKEHWLDHAKEKFSGKLIFDMKIVFAVLFLYTPLPIFWSLFDQQGSRWTFQASKMNGMVFGVQILPDQMQVINPAIVLILIPVFDRYFYPYFNKINFLESPLHRMAIGGLISGFAFLAAGIVELVLETTYPELPHKHKASINIINTLPCTLKISGPFNIVYDLKSAELYSFKNLDAFNTTQYNIMVNAPKVCSDLKLSGAEFKLTIQAIESQIDTVLVGINNKHGIKAFTTNPVDFKKSLSGKPKIRIVYIKSSPVLHNVTVTLRGIGGFRDIYFVSDQAIDNLAVSEYMELPAGEYEYIIESKEIPKLLENMIQLLLGGVYTLVLRENQGIIKFSRMYTMSPPNTVNILWLIPQYFLISVAEIMFGIAGLEFSFTQAPKCLKTITLAAWYLSVAVGNFLVIIITQAGFFKSQANEFFLFAMMIVADMMIFTEMAAHYEIVQLEADSSAVVCNSDEDEPLLKEESEF